MLPQPGMQTNIYADWTIKRTDPALNATFRLRNYLPGGQRSHMLGFGAEWESHEAKKFLV
jgi:hypothetical protein